MSRLSQPESACLSPLRDIQRMVELTARLTAKPHGEILRRLRMEYADMGSSVRQALKEAGIRPFFWSDRMFKFYEQTDAFLFETMVWNMTFAKCELRAWILKYLGRAGAGESLLTFGDGLGFDAFFFAFAGFQVTYYEVSRMCAEFAKSVFDDGKQQIEMLTDPGSIEDRKFDLIVCLDVLEHVPDPPALVQWLGARLNPGGRLIVSAPFYLLNRSVQTHLKCNRQFSGDYRRLYQPAGLTPVAGRLFWNPVVLQKNVSTTVPWNLLLGSALLWPGRFWSAPFSLVSNSMVRKKHPLDPAGPYPAATEISSDG